MSDSFDLAALAALAAALGWASGLRLYAVVFMIGAAGAFDWVALPPGLQVLQHPAVLVASGLMLLLEFVADKIPGLDSAWDALHTLLRIPAGAALAAMAFGGDHRDWALVAALLGGSLAAASHAAKATTRLAINTSPEPFSNIALSLAGDVAVPAMLWLALAHPLVFVLVLLPVLAAMLALTVWLWRFLAAAVRRFGRSRRAVAPLA